MEELANVVSYKINNYVVMANEIIKGKQDMTLQEARFMRFLITQIIKKDKELKSYNINIRDLARCLHIDMSNMYSDIRNLCNKLLTRTISIWTGNAKQPWKTFQWLNSASYDGLGTITVRLSNDLKPYLLCLNTWFTKYKLGSMLYINSYYAIRFYELVKMNLGINSKHNSKNIFDFEFTIKYLKEYFCCEKKFERISNFKSKVIDICIKEINEKTDLLINAEYIKTGRTITSIRFFVEEKVDTEYIEEKGQDIIDLEKVVAIEQPENFISDNQDMEQNQELAIDMNQNDIDIDDLLDNLRDIIKYPFKIRELKEILISADNKIDIVQAKYKLAINRIKNKDLDDKELKHWLIWAIKTDYKESEPNSSNITSDEELDDNADRLRAFINEPLRIKDLKAILISANNDVELVKQKYNIAKTQGNIDNITAWLISAIKGDYANPITVEKKSKQNRFINFEQREWSTEKFEELEKLDRKRIDDRIKKYEESEKLDRKCIDE